MLAEESGGAGAVERGLAFVVAHVHIRPKFKQRL